LASALAAPAPTPCLFWLGQAGFAVRLHNTLLLIDPYLSDALATKYAGTAFPHERMMRSPINVAELPPVDWVLVTHRHGDHLDRVALPAIATRSPECRFVIPAADAELARSIGLPQHRLLPIDAGEDLELGPWCVHAIAAAHEAVERDESGHHRFLGYILVSDHETFYHSGDCVPFDGLSTALSAFRLDLALLPVNGRDTHRADLGIPGNFTLDEAVYLCEALNIPTLMAHHFGMFAFNTVPRSDILLKSTTLGGRLELLPATLHTRYVLSGDREGVRT
jgi:L-ascorbate metabolism protein UlaG (beta-lactamase superfamily)